MPDSVKLHAVVVTEEGEYAVQTVRHFPHEMNEGKPFRLLKWKGGGALDNRDVVALLIPRNIGKSLRERQDVYNAALAAGVTPAVIQ